MYIGLCIKYFLFLFDFNETWIFSKFFSKKSQTSDFMKILPLVAELLHADRRTDRHDEANIRCSQFWENRNSLSAGLPEM